MRRNFLWSSLLLLISTGSYATVGGEQTIEFLGYEPREKKVYVLRHYHDGRGRLPQLYYYDFKDRDQNTLIEVESLYLDPKTGQVNYDGNQVTFEKELQKIKRRLRTLYPVNPKAFNINTLKTEETTIPSWYDEQNTVPEYHHQYQVQDAKYQSSPQTSVSYTPELHIEQAFRIPQQDQIVVTVKYLGIPFETGYSIEDPILLEKK